MHSDLIRAYMFCVCRLSKGKGGRHPELLLSPGKWRVLPGASGGPRKDLILPALHVRLSCWWAAHPQRSVVCQSSLLLTVKPLKPTRLKILAIYLKEWDHNFTQAEKHWVLHWSSDQWKCVFVKSYRVQLSKGHDKSVTRRAKFDMLF